MGNGPTNGTDPSGLEKFHLPSLQKGRWINGEPGNGVFEYYDNDQNRKAGVAKERVGFKNNHIAIGGFPTSWYYRGNRELATVPIDKVLGGRSDMAEADRKMRIKLNDPNWKRPEGYVWNHAGEPGDGPKQMELVESRKGWRHGAVAHTGSASVPRAAARGVVVKGIAIIDAYLTLKEAFEMGSEKGTEVDWRAAVFADENGDMFKLEIPNLLSSMFYSPRITYIAGERDGEEVEISSDEADKLVDTYYALFGRFVKGSWGFPDRFIPGDVRTVLPAIRIHADGSVEEGYIDETGPHFEKGIEQVFRDLTNELSM